MLPMRRRFIKSNSRDRGRLTRNEDVLGLALGRRTKLIVIVHKLVNRGVSELTHGVKMEKALRTCLLEWGLSIVHNYYKVKYAPLSTYRN